MARNAVRFQKGYSLRQFFAEYGTEEQCAEALYRWRWPNGFVRPRCHYTGFCALNTRALFQNEPENVLLLKLSYWLPM